MASGGTIIDQAKREVILPRHTSRLVSLTPSNTEIVYALGKEEMLVGVTEFCDYPQEAKGKDKVGGFTNVDLNKVKALKPDLILAGKIHQGEVIPKLDGLGYNSIILDASNIEDLLEAITLTGTITDKKELAESINQKLRNRTNAITTKILNLNINEIPTVYFLHEMGTWKTFGLGSIGDNLTQLAGGYNIGRDFGDYYTYPGLEGIIKSDPDIIIAEIGYGANPNEPVEAVQCEPRLAKAKARRHNRVYGIESDLISRPGPRLVDGLEALARIIHPELFC
jgi:iron complex transport system substrate-binding protein